MTRTTRSARRPATGLTAVLALFAGGLALAPAGPAAAAISERLAGTDRYSTAAAVSASRFTPGVPVAFVATGTSFPDALAGGAAAATLGGPVLLTGRDAVPAATDAELTRLKPARVVVLGGTGAVSGSVLTALKARTTGAVDRLSGSDRYATAAAIARAAFSPGVATAYVTTGTAFADALSAGAAAGSRQVPVLLTSPGALPAATADELRRLRPASITILGGANAVSAAVEAALRPLSSGAVTRVSGVDRYATSAAVSKDAFSAAKTVYLATGAGFPDALAGGPVAALAPGPLLLTTRTCLPPAVDAEVRRLAPDRVVVLGGEGAISAAVQSGAVCQVPAPAPAPAPAPPVPPSQGGGEPAPTGRVVGGPAVSSVLEARDYASEAFADPWDYSNSEDIHVGTPQMANAGTVSGGQLSYQTATQYPWMDPLPYLPGSMPLERDGPSAPIDTAAFTHLSVRMYASRNSPAQISWSTCDWSRDASCKGAMGVGVRAGWNTYDWKIAPNETTQRAPWAGRALQLRFLPSVYQDVTIKVDEMRLHGDLAPIRFALEPAGPTSEVFWDANGDLTDNTADNPRWGRLGITTTSSYDLAAAQLPPGTYRLYTRSGTATGPYTGPLTITPRSRPVIDSPSLAGGADYATTVRRDAWDFNSLGDLGRRENMCSARILTGGVLAANNCGPEIDNPYFFLPNPTAINGNTYHRLTMRIRYDGVFGLTGGPTGGAVARLIWYVASDKAASDQNVHDIVVYPGWQTITVDLKTNPPAAVTDESQRGARIGWAGQTITSLRLDPNEDVSARNWYVDFVRLTKDVEGRGAFDLAFRETAGLPGQSATVYLDRDRTGRDGVLAATTPVGAGRNTVRALMPAGLADGTYWPYVVVDGPDGPVTRYAASPVTLVR